MRRGRFHDNDPPPWDLPRGQEPETP
jgi:hypothetical protein